jgi:hypothetical protein
VFVQFLADGVPLEGTGNLPTMAPFFASTPALAVPLASFMGMVCGAAWDVCTASHGLRSEGNLHRTPDEVRLSFFVDAPPVDAPEPTAAILLSMALVVLGSSPGGDAAG